MLLLFKKKKNSLTKCFIPTDTWILQWLAKRVKSLCRLSVNVINICMHVISVMYVITNCHYFSDVNWKSCQSLLESGYVVFLPLFEKSLMLLYIWYVSIVDFCLLFMPKVLIFACNFIIADFCLLLIPKVLLCYVVYYCAHFVYICLKKVLCLCFCKYKLFQN